MHDSERLSVVSRGNMHQRNSNPVTDEIQLLHIYFSKN